MELAIPVEQIGTEHQRIPALLVGIEKTTCTIKYTANHSTIKVGLSELQLAPNAFSFDEKYGIYSGSSENGEISQFSNHNFSPRDPVEVWLDSGSTGKKKSITDVEASDSAETVSGTPPGAWWPGRVLTIQGGFAHVEVAAPLQEYTGVEDKPTAHAIPHLIGLGASLLPYRSTLVKVTEIRIPWNGKFVSSHSEDQSQTGPLAPGFMKDNLVESNSLLVPGILHRHSICIPAYLYRLATNPESHLTLAKFCGAPCLIQCDSDPFLPGTFAKMILGDKEGPSESGQHNTTHADSGSISPSLCLSTYTWPSPSLISQSAIMNVPHIAGTLSLAGITDPNILLTGLPGANEPLVLLHIWSGSSEAIRRATFLELGHIRLLAVRYHLLRNLSKGETGELELSNSAELDVDDGEAPAIHCKPISMPATSSSDKQASGGMIIGYECRFRILPHLIGLAIGHRGATIQEARGIPGVRAVDLLFDGIVHVEAETIEACHAVRNLLDFTEVEIPVQPRLASRLIGSKGMNIRKLAEAAGVRRAKLLDPFARKRRLMAQRQNHCPARVHVEHGSSVTDGDVHEDTSNGEETDNGNEKLSVNLDGYLNDNNDSSGIIDLSPAFSLVGTRASVAKMRLLLEFQADNWNELDELEEARRSLFSQLRQTNQLNHQPDSVSPTRISNGRPIRGGGNLGRNRVMGRGRRQPESLPPEHFLDNNEVPRPLNSRGQHSRGKSIHQPDIFNNQGKNRQSLVSDSYTGYSNGVMSTSDHENRQADNETNKNNSLGTHNANDVQTPKQNNGTSRRNQNRHKSRAS
uniref:Fragile X mental retardation syndrome 1 homolog n=1 Tax=Schistosoma japonicum TaxID=6182 RepID=C1LKL3_SCHJA|nr:fragile X mental retardation syndrome 1 homolog [Schistosoma japonicum]